MGWKVRSRGILSSLRGGESCGWEMDEIQSRALLIMVEAKYGSERRKIFQRISALSVFSLDFRHFHFALVLQLYRSPLIQY